MEKIPLKLREDRVRRQLRRLGYSLEKTPTRSWQRQYFQPGYSVLAGKLIVLGCGSREWDATIEQVEAFAVATR